MYIIEENASNFQILCTCTAFLLLSSCLDRANKQIRIYTDLILFMSVRRIYVRVRRIRDNGSICITLRVSYPIVYLIGQCRVCLPEIMCRKSYFRRGK